MNQKLVITVIVIAAVAFALGRFSSPKKMEVKEVEKIVYRDRETKEKDQNVKEVEKETRLPDGTVIKEKTKIKETQSRTLTETESQKDQRSEKRIENRPSWRIGLSYEVPYRDVQEVHYSLILERRLFGEVYFGGIISTDRTVGLMLSFGF